MVGREFAFHKYEGLGNDFIVLDAAEEGTVAPARALALCDRRLGIGADGVILSRKYSEMKLGNLAGAKG